MKLGLVKAALVGLGMVSGASFAAAATYDIDFTGTDGVGTLTANMILNVTGTNITSATGTISSPFWAGYDTISLVTLTTPGSGTWNNDGVHTQFRFGGGTDLGGNTTYPIDNYWGLVFQINNPSQPNLNAGFNIWSDGGNQYSLFLAGGVPTGGSGILYNQYNGPASVSAVPVPAALPMFLAALAGIGGITFVRRRKIAKSA